MQMLQMQMLQRQHQDEHEHEHTQTVHHYLSAVNDTRTMQFEIGSEVTKSVLK